jgi:hypothetical protein
MSAVSPDAFDRLKQEGLLDDLLGELESDDIMLLLNGIETLSKVGSVVWYFRADSLVSSWG